jgi:transcriptional regulator GlxA family with amidase domain
MRIVVVTLDSVFDTGLSTALDVFGIAASLAASIARRAHLEVSVSAVRRRVRTARGLVVPVTPIQVNRPPDVVLVPALGAKTPEAVERAMTRSDVADVGALLRAWHNAGTMISAACTGTFVLAESGLLDARHATTTWWLGPIFRRRYPLVRLDESQMLVRSGPCVTAGAALAHVDLALWIVRRESGRLAEATARYLTADVRAAQSRFIIPEHVARTEPLVERFDRWVRTHLADGFSLSAAARGVGASERTLSRRMRSVLGKSPLSYVQDVRIDEAVRLLRDDHLSIDDIAGRVGYADGVTLRTLLRRRTGRGVRDLRRRQ